MENIKKAAQLIARGMWKRKPESSGSDVNKFERFDSRMYGAAGIETLRDRKIAETDWVSFMIKLLRAYGECLGARRR